MPFWPGSKPPPPAAPPVAPATSPAGAPDPFAGHDPMAPHPAASVGADAAGVTPAGSAPGAEATATGGTLTPPEAVERAVAVLKEVYDPEIPVNIYDLGMIYNVEVSPELHVAVRMTLTSPMCPVAGSLPGEVETRLREIPGVHGATVELVWDPPWDRDMMSEAARLTLGF